ncbi:unnamed protein product, partial [marine sediment metagenome]
EYVRRKDDKQSILTGVVLRTQFLILSLNVFVYDFELVQKDCFLYQLELHLGKMFVDNELLTTTKDKVVLNSTT